MTSSTPTVRTSGKHCGNILYIQYVHVRFSCYLISSCVVCLFLTCSDAVDSVTSLYNHVEEQAHFLVQRSNVSLEHLEYLLQLREMEGHFTQVLASSLTDHDMCI